MLFSQQDFLSGRQDFPRRSATSCRIPLRRLRSLTLPSWQSFPKKAPSFRFFWDRLLRFKSCLPSIIRFKIKKTLLLSQQGFLSGRQDFPVLSQTSCLLRHRRLRSLTLPSWQSFLKKSSKFSLFFQDRSLRFKSCLPSIIRFKIKKTLLLSQQGFLSGRQDLNLRHPGPKPDALPAALLPV